MDVQLVEVGPRDGLQNESAILDTKTKVALVRRLMDAGATRIEVASFVHPRLVPQMADAENVCAALPESQYVSYIGVVLNGRGLDRALSTNVNEVNFVVAASEEFSERNQGAALEEAVSEVERMIPVARGADRFVTVTISVAFGCPFEGEVDPATVIRLAERAVAAGAQEVALGDTIGVAVPSDVSRIVPQLQDAIGDSVLRVHFHDTRRTGLGNVAEALRLGVRVVDASVGGAGGCPFAPQATGNVATEDVLYLFERAGYEHGIDGGAIVETGRWLGDQLGVKLPAAIARSGGFPTGRASDEQE
ncbi:MAG: hydroxymethylglutaryl-CoA lyase [Acidobacteria bacterium]|nr:hydroxymethylglutaryl-CoA lyase [Acidobacteriota bacterium]MCH8985772.1 hydroxymethylglutaryl-CoA lyase [Acidobacteriota bacterium]